MPYSTPTDVRLIVDTTLTDTQITAIIQMSDTQIDARIGSQSTPGELVKKLSALLTAHAIKTRQPQSLAVGEYKEDTGDREDLQTPRKRLGEGLRLRPHR